MSGVQSASEDCENQQPKIIHTFFLFPSTVAPEFQSSDIKSTMATRYWVASLPVQNSASSLWSRLQDSISKHSFDTPLYRVLIYMYVF